MKCHLLGKALLLQSLAHCSQEWASQKAGMGRRGFHLLLLSHLLLIDSGRGESFPSAVLPFTAGIRWIAQSNAHADDTG